MYEVDIEVNVNKSDKLMAYAERMSKLLKDRENTEKNEEE